MFQSTEKCPEMLARAGIPMMMPIRISVQADVVREFRAALGVLDSGMKF
jgi:hypothetical protein